jgi:hypothetical protein
MNELFRFIGKDRSMGYTHGQIYMLELMGRGMGDVFITAPIKCPYTSWNTFFLNWERANEA